MIDHVTIPVAHLEKSKDFYEQAFAPLGYKVSFGEESIFWAFDIGDGLFEIRQKREDENLASFHIAFKVSSRQKVYEFYESSLAAGGKCNGSPGPRPQYTEHYFACFIRDLDGNNIEAMIEKPE